MNDWGILAMEVSKSIWLFGWAIQDHIFGGKKGLFGRRPAKAIKARKNLGRGPINPIPEKPGGFLKKKNKNFGASWGDSTAKTGLGHKWPRAWKKFGGENKGENFFNRQRLKGNLGKNGG